MLNDTVVQILPARVSVTLRLLDVPSNPNHTSRAERLGLAQRVAVQRLDPRPAHELWRREALDEVAFVCVSMLLRRRRGDAQRLRNLGQLVVLGHTLEEIRLLVVVRCEHDEEDDIAQRGGPLRLVCHNGGGVVDLAVELAHVEILGAVQTPEDHERVVAQLEVLRMVSVVDRVSANVPRGPSQRAI